MTTYVALIVGIPAVLVFEPLGRAGTPALMLGLVCLVWWVVGRIDRGLGLRRGRQPLRLLTGVFLGAMVFSYTIAALRPTETSEMLSADRSLLTFLSGAGILLITADGLRNRQDLDTVVRRIALAGGFLASLGLVQFFLGLEVATYIKVPGLSYNDVAQLIQERSGFRRVAGTASHPIEFGVVLAMVLPIALHCAMTATRHRLRYWVNVAAVGIAIPTSVSRSAMLGVGVVWVVLVVGWDARRRANVLLATPVALAGMRLMVPGLLGTLRSLFTGISTDPSYLGRTQDYEVVRRFINERPLFGRGVGTFFPDLYVLLDNQYLLQIIETGYVGLAVLLVLLGSGPYLAWRLKREAADDTERSLAVALCGASLVPMVTFVTFDGFAFSIVAGCTFLVLGCIGAARAVHADEAAGGRQAEPARPAAPATATSAAS